MRTIHRGFRRSAVAVPLILLVTVSVSHAQAWLPAKGEGTASVLFTNTLSKDHFLPDERYDFGHIDANTFLFDVTYGLTDRVAVSVGLPLVISRYRGENPHKPITLDDGFWHATPQDFRFGLRYNAVRGRTMVTPFVGTDIPSHDYEFFTHAAPGRGLKEFQAGIAAGRLFPTLGLVVQGRYAHAFSERALPEFPRRYSLAALEAAYFVTPAVRLLAMSAHRRGHTGIDLWPTSSQELPGEVFYHHDRITRESYWNLGGGAGVSLSDRIDVFGAFTSTVTGRNTHAVNRGLSIGVSWSFGRSDPFRLASRDPRTGALVRCLCQKAAD